MPSMSAVGRSRPGQNCKPPTPSLGISAQLVAWQKQHSLSASAANSRRASEGLSLPSRQASARAQSSRGELRTSLEESEENLSSCGSANGLLGGKWQH